MLLLLRLWLLDGSGSQDTEDFGRSMDGVQ